MVLVHSAVEVQHVRDCCDQVLTVYCEDNVASTALQSLAVILGYDPRYSLKAELSQNLFLTR